MSMAVGEPSDDDVMSEINTTPLVDVMLVLLIIFLITIPVVTTSIPVSLPKERVEESGVVLQRLGAETTVRIYRGLGHSVNLEELEWVRALALQLEGSA